jgi:hypothetical protein
MRITILDVNPETPPALGILNVSVLLSGNLRNWPPTCAPSSHSFNGTLDGSFGPEAIKIVQLVANDGGSGKGTFDVNDTIKLILSERTDRGGLPELMTFEQVNSLLSFNQRIGSNYFGRWLQSGVWVSPLGSAIIPDVPYSKVLEITILNASGASPPTVNTLRATFLPSAKVRNIPPVCTPASTVSPPLSGDFGPSQIVIVGISARGDVNCLHAMCDSIFGDGDVIDIEFSEEVTMCMSSCACANLTDNSSKCVRPFDTSVSQEFLDISFEWSHNLGLIYYGLWLSRTVLRVQIINSTGATPPQLYDFTVKVTNAAGIRNFPPTSRVSALVSNGLCQTKRDKLDLDCGFGRPAILIKR